MAKTVKTQRRGEITKRQLVDSTKRLLTEYDYQTVTLDKISSEVGVAKSSILWHFGSKERLLTEAVYSVFEEVHEKINLAKRDLPTLAERIDYLLGKVADYYIASRGAKGVAITLVFNSRIPPEIPESIRGHWRQHLVEITAFLAGDDGSLSTAGVAGLLALMHGVYIQWYLDGCPDGLHGRLLDAFHGLQIDEVSRLRDQ